MRRMIAGGTVALLLATPAGVDAQVAVGFRGGAQISGIQSSQSTSAVTEPVYGAYIGFGISDRLAFQTEVVFGARGARELGLATDALDDAAPDVRLDMRYIEVPFLLRAGFPGDRALVSAFAGPYVGFLLSCDVTPDGAGTTSCDDESATQRFAPRSTDYGLVLGAGLDLAFGESTLFADARYTLGIRSIQDASDAFDARHTGIAITGGLAVPLGR